MMDEHMNNVTDLVEVTDSLEAIAVFRGWKNIFFIIALICLLIIQGAFWIVDLGILTPDTAALVQQQGTALIAADVNAVSVSKGTDIYGFTFVHLANVIKICNGLLLISALLYCMTLLFSMIITVIGRLGGMRHICRAFFWAQIMFVLTIPWQQFFDSMFLGCIYSPAELTGAISVKSAEIMPMILYYLRFSGYWLLIMLFLIISQTRCARWGKSILRRLEII